MKMLGAVGIGGFYAQGALSAASHLQHQTDENQPSGSRERFVALCIQDAEAIVELSICQQLELSECFHVIEFFFCLFRSPIEGVRHDTGHGKKGRQGKTVRLNINARERRRMHDLNDALDELRSVM